MFSGLPEVLMRNHSQHKLREPFRQHYCNWSCNNCQKVIDLLCRREINRETNNVTKKSYRGCLHSKWTALDGGRNSHLRSWICTFTEYRHRLQNTENPHWHWKAGENLPPFIWNTLRTVWQGTSPSFLLPRMQPRLWVARVCPKCGWCSPRRLYCRGPWSFPVRQMSEMPGCLVNLSIAGFSVG